MRELLDDARGDSYMNQIESLYDELGTSSRHVSQMLSNLPAEEPPTHQRTPPPRSTARKTPSPSRRSRAEL